MRAVEETTRDRRRRDASPSPTTRARYGVVAAVLAAVGVLGLVVMITWAFFAIIGLIYSPDGWSSLYQVAWEGR
ncbi:MAG: hypothetical protein L0206_12705 [Actinobacteria bacterium]|nr:hypothetical protein [Actinomycetota bacterium]